MSNEDSREQDFPLVAVVGGESLSTTHGTGWALSRHLGRFPREKIFDVYYQGRGESYFTSMHVPFRGWRRKLYPWERLMARCGILGDFYTSQEGPRYHFSEIPRNWGGKGTPPRVIYSTAFMNSSFAFLNHVHSACPKGTPIIQHFLDFQPEDEAVFLRLWKRIDACVTEVWSLNESMKVRLENTLGREVKTVSCLHREIPVAWKQFHRPFEPGFRAVMIGNVWQPEVFRKLEVLWGAARDLLPDLAPLRWYGHPRRFVELGRPKESLQNVEDGGMLSTEDLLTVLAESDLGVLPFNCEFSDVNYARYSLPSRLADFCAVGLPILALATPGTEVWRFAQNLGVGCCLTVSPLEATVSQLVDYLQDQKRRAADGERGRHYAERHLNLEDHISFLREHFRRAATFGV